MLSVSMLGVIMLSVKALFCRQKISILAQLEMAHPTNTHPGEAFGQKNALTRCHTFINFSFQLKKKYFFNFLPNGRF
jgi:hypothetical protein